MGSFHRLQRSQPLAKQHRRQAESTVDSKAAVPSSSSAAASGTSGLSGAAIAADSKLQLSSTAADLNHIPWYFWLCVGAIAVLILGLIWALVALCRARRASKRSQKAASPSQKQADTDAWQKNLRSNSFKTVSSVSNNEKLFPIDIARDTTDAQSTYSQNTAVDQPPMNSHTTPPSSPPRTRLHGRQSNWSPADAPRDLRRTPPSNFQADMAQSPHMRPLQLAASPNWRNNSVRHAPLSPPRPSGTSNAEHKPVTWVYSTYSVDEQDKEDKEVLNVRGARTAYENDPRRPAYYL